MNTADGTSEKVKETINYSNCFMVRDSCPVFFLPVPFSAVMLQRQISSWSKFDFSYVSHSTWVNENEISPQIYLAVIASEDQNFPKHWGFDFDAIEKFSKIACKAQKRYEVPLLFHNKRSKTYFCGMGAVG